MYSLSEGQGSTVPLQLPSQRCPLSVPPSMWDLGCLKRPFGAENFALTACSVNRGSH